MLDFGLPAAPPLKGKGTDGGGRVLFLGTAGHESKNSSHVWAPNLLLATRIFKLSPGVLSVSSGVSQRRFQKQSGWGKNAQGEIESGSRIVDEIPENDVPERVEEMGQHFIWPQHRGMGPFLSFGA